MVNTERDFLFDRQLHQIFARIEDECAEADLLPVLVLTKQRDTGRIIVIQPDIVTPPEILSWLEEVALFYTQQEERGAE